MTQELEEGSPEARSDLDRLVEQAGQPAFELAYELEAMAHEVMRPYSSIVAEAMAARDAAIEDRARFASGYLMQTDPTVQAAQDVTDAVVRLYDQGVRTAEIAQRQEAALGVVISELRASRVSADRAGQRLDRLTARLVLYTAALFVLTVVLVVLEIASRSDIGR